MKVVHISTTDYGGAFKAAKRISESMESVGVGSRVLVRTKTREDEKVLQIFHHPISRFLSKCKNVGNLLLSKGEIISDYFGTDISKNMLVKEADVIVLHWVNSFVSYKVVEKLIKLKKPMIWVMHDMWLFTGGCHCDGYCRRYENECGNCPLIESRKEKDISRKNFLRKQKMMSVGNIQVVGPSRWIVDCAKKSRILENCNLEWIPNPIDDNIFHPIDLKEEIKKKYGIPTNKKIILFGAVNATGDKNKGSQYLTEAIHQLDSTEYMLVVFGNKPGYIMDTGNMEAKYLGYIYNEKELADIYNIADVFAAPSEQESFGYTVGEALACGTPVVAFAIGGIVDQVIHKENGYLAKFKDIDDFATGIQYSSSIKNDTGLKKGSYMQIGNRYKSLCENGKVK